MLFTMPYLVKQKFKLTDLVEMSQPKRVLIVEPEPYLAALYRRQLRLHGFAAEQGMAENGRLPDTLAWPADVLLLNPESFGKPAFAVENIGQILRRHPLLLIVTVTRDVHPDFLKDFMAAGVAGHINLRLSRPHDIPAVVKTLLHNN